MNWEGSSAYSMNPLRIKMKDRERNSPGEGEKENLRGKTPGIGAARKESRKEKSPGEGEKESLRGKTSGIGAARKESRKEKSPGEGEKESLRGALEFLGADQCVFVRYPVVMGEHDYTGRLKFYVEHVVQGRPMYIDDPDDKMAFIHEKEAGMFIAHLVDQQVSGAVNGASFGMISPREIISYIERKVGRKAVFDDHGDIAPYNGAAANISYDTSIARGCGFTFSKVEDWIYKLLDHEIIGNP